MSLDHSTLVPGQRISEKVYVLDSETVTRYSDAVEARSGSLSGDDGRELVPPMAIAALSLRGVVTDLRIPGGTLHVGQELEFRSGVHLGTSLECNATLAQNSVRGGWRFLVVQLEVSDGQGGRVMDGKSTIVLPVG